MPQKYKLNHKPCPTNYNDKLLNPMCRLPAKEFEPHNKPHKPHPPPPPPHHKPHHVIPYNPYKPKPIIPGVLPPVNPTPTPAIPIPYKPKPIIPGVPTPNQPDSPDKPNKGNPYMATRMRGVVRDFKFPGNIEDLSPDLKMKAEMMTMAYKAREDYDKIMHRTIINENTARAARRQHPLSEYTPRENDQFVEANHEAATDIALKRVQETVKQRFGDDFTIEEKYCTPDLLVFKKGLTRYIVKHGASSGLGETFTGDKINAYDEESYELAYKNAENKTGQRYPELDEVMRKFNKDWINLKNVETVGYSNASPQMLYLNKNYGIRTTIFDGVVGQAQLKDIRNGLPAEAHMVSLTSGAPAQDLGRL